MTRRELVEALETNFKPDDIVPFLYVDSDYGETTDTEVVVKDHTELFKNGYWEYYDGQLNKWVKESSPIDPSTIFCKRRWRTDGTTRKVTKKVLYIGG